MIFPLAEKIASTLEKALTFIEEVLSLLVSLIGEDSRVLSLTKSFLKEALVSVVEALVLFAPVLIWLDTALFPFRKRVLILLHQLANVVQKGIGDSVPGFDLADRPVSLTNCVSFNGYALGNNHIFRMSPYGDIEDIMKDSPEGFVDLLEVRGVYLVLQFPHDMDDATKLDMFYYVEEYLGSTQ